MAIPSIAICLHVPLHGTISVIVFSNSYMESLGFPCALQSLLLIHVRDCLAMRCVGFGTMIFQVELQLFGHTLHRVRIGVCTVGDVVVNSGKLFHSTLLRTQTRFGSPC